MAAPTAGEIRLKSNVSTAAIVRAVLRGRIDSIEPTKMDAQLMQRLQQLWLSGRAQWCVLYLKNGKEHRTAWFLSRTHCQRAFEIITVKHGYQAVIYRS